MLLVPIFSIYRNVLPSTVPRASYPPVPFQTTLTLSLFLSHSLSRPLTLSLLAPFNSTPLPRPIGSTFPMAINNFETAATFQGKNKFSRLLDWKKTTPLLRYCLLLPQPPNRPTDQPPTHPPPTLSQPPCARSFRHPSTQPGTPGARASALSLASPASLCVTSPSPTQSDSKRTDLVTCSFLACQPSVLSTLPTPLRPSRRPPPRNRPRLSSPSVPPVPLAQVVMENRTHRPSSLYAFLCDEIQRGR